MVYKKYYFLLICAINIHYNLYYYFRIIYNIFMYACTVINTMVDEYIIVLLVYLTTELLKPRLVLELKKKLFLIN